MAEASERGEGAGHGAAAWSAIPAAVTAQCVASGWPRILLGYWCVRDSLKNKVNTALFCLLSRQWRSAQSRSRTCTWPRAGLFWRGRACRGAGQAPGLPGSAAGRAGSGARRDRRVLRDSRVALQAEATRAGVRGRRRGGAVARVCRPRFSHGGLGSAPSQQGAAGVPARGAIWPCSHGAHSWRKESTQGPFNQAARIRFPLLLWSSVEFEVGGNTATILDV